VSRSRGTLAIWRARNNDSSTSSGRLRRFGRFILSLIGLEFARHTSDEWPFVIVWQLLMGGALAVARLGTCVALLSVRSSSALGAVSVAASGPALFRSAGRPLPSLSQSASSPGPAVEMVSPASPAPLGGCDGGPSVAVWRAYPAEVDGGHGEPGAGGGCGSPLGVRSPPPGPLLVLAFVVCPSWIDSLLAGAGEVGECEVMASLRICLITAVAL
jgi:hypothetical protein